MTEPYDVLVIGGGINGAGIARDAAGRGMRVLLCEKGDLAEGTSSRSSKLVHGGLRYLEQYAFRLVREALKEREVLLRIAPHIVWPMRFVIPHSPEQRPAWMLRLGLFLYDNLGGRVRLPGSRRLDLGRSPEGAPVQDRFRTAFEYADCWVDDARMVVLNALDAQQRGADIRIRVAAIQARRIGGLWQVQLRAEDGTTSEVQARALVNAAGPWVDSIIQGVAGSTARDRLRLVKGSHLVVRKLWDGKQAYLLQNDDKRVIFAIPYEDEFCLIGTTDTPFTGRAEDVAVDAAERAYLLRAVNRYLRRQVTQDDIVAEYAGIRPLHDDQAASASTVTRDYAFGIDAGAPGERLPPLLSIYGGKITTYRKLAEHALAKLAFQLAAPGSRLRLKGWTGDAPLPGGDMPDADFDVYLSQFCAARPWLPPALGHHYARLYGTRAEALLEGARSFADLGTHFGAQFYAREAEFLRRTEWARHPDDVLRRRTKHYLHLSPAAAAGIPGVVGAGLTGADVRWNARLLRITSCGYCPNSSPSCPPSRA